MNLSTQLRAILLIAGMVLLVAIYFWGRRRQGVTRRASAVLDGDSDRHRDHGLDHGFDNDSDAPHVMYDEPVHARPADAPGADRIDLATSADHETPPAWDDLPPIYAERQQTAHTAAVPAFNAQSPAHEPTIDVLREDLPHDETGVPADDVEASWGEPDRVETGRLESGRVEPRMTDEPTNAGTAGLSEAERAPALQVPTIDESLVTAPHRARQPAPVASQVTPTLSEPVPARVEPQSQPLRAPTQPSKPGSRKIVALRVALAGERISGEQLLQCFAAQRLQHGKFNIFHRLYDGRIVFSVASMIEPGSFDLTTMQEQQFPGVTLFALLPGPVDGVHAFEQLLECGQHLAQAMNAVLQDERGTKLTPHAIERLRDEVLDFQHLLSGAATS